MVVNFKHEPLSLVVNGDDAESLNRWRSEMERAFPPLTIHAANTQPFKARYRSAGTEELQISDIQASAHVVERNPGVVSSKNFEYYKISLQVSGTGQMTQGDRELSLTPGTIAVYDTAQPYDLRFDEDYRFVVAMFPKHALDIPARLANELVAYPLDGTTGPGSMLSSYLMGLVENLDYLSGASGERLARTGLDLLTTLLAAELELQGADARPERRSLLVEICYYINEHLTDPNLTPEQIALAHFISTRHLYNVFQETGVSVAQWIKFRRLTECRRDLADPIKINWTVSQIASRWSFNEAGYFSRIFKENFGLPPGEWRKNAMLSAR
jgi:AraC-like DNA-binding protein